MTESQVWRTVRHQAAILLSPTGKMRSLWLAYEITEVRVREVR